jgi:hypothetical protein
MSTHGEAPVAPYHITVAGGVLTARASLPEAHLRFERRISFTSPTTIRIAEEVENLGTWDRPIAWIQHVTLGDPFIEPGVTQFRAPATKSKVYEVDVAGDKAYMQIGAAFDWPNVPRIGGPAVDMRTYIDLPVSGAFTAHLMDPRREQAFFLAWSPKSKVLIGYVWKRSDFPWLGIWEENHCRTAPPWNGKTLTRAMEFGVTPFPDGRHRMMERGSLFGVPCYRWIPARSKVAVEYSAFVTTAEAIPDQPPQL